VIEALQYQLYVVARATFESFKSINGRSGQWKYNAFDSPVTVCVRQLGDELQTLQQERN
jgi:hypothetical protein